MNEIPKKVSDSVRRLNPHLYGVGRLQASKPEPPQGIEVKDKELEGGKGVVAFRVTLVLCLLKPYDDDNAVSSCKSLRDAIAESLGIDDGDSRIEFNYNQIKTSGREGVNVIIEQYEQAG